MVKERMVAAIADYNGVPKKKKATPKKKKAAPKKKKTAPKKKAATNKQPSTSGSSGRGAAMAPEQLAIFETWHYNSLGKKYFGELQMEYKTNDKFRPFTNYHQWLAPELFYTDATLCALDGFNLGI